MGRRHFSEAPIVGILKELEAGSPATELGRRHGKHPNTIRLKKNKYAGLKSIDLDRLKQLESENSQMQRIMARQTIEIDAVRTLIEKRLGLSPRKEAVRALQQLGVSRVSPKRTLVNRFYARSFSQWLRNSNDERRQ